MAQAHLPMDQILISLAQMVHFGWEQPLIIPDFGIFKVCAIPPTLLVTVEQKPDSKVTHCASPASHQAGIGRASLDEPPIPKVF